MRKLSFYRRIYHSDKLSGQSLVEFALFVPILILLLAGAVDLGNGFQTWITLTNATREGARKGASTSSTSAICGRVQEELTNNSITVSCGTSNISYPAYNDGTTVCSGTRTKRCPIRLTITYAMNTLLGSVLGFNTINISAFNDMLVITP